MINAVTIKICRQFHRELPQLVTCFYFWIQSKFLVHSDLETQYNVTEEVTGVVKKQSDRSMYATLQILLKPALKPVFAVSVSLTQQEPTSQVHFTTLEPVWSIKSSNLTAWGNEGMFEMIQIIQNIIRKPLINLCMRSIWPKSSLGRASLGRVSIHQNTQYKIDQSCHDTAFFCIALKAGFMIYRMTA